MLCWSLKPLLFWRKKPQHGAVDASHRAPVCKKSRASFPRSLTTLWRFLRLFRALRGWPYDKAPPQYGEVPRASNSGINGILWRSHHDARSSALSGTPREGSVSPVVQKRIHQRSRSPLPPRHLVLGAPAALKMLGRIDTAKTAKCGGRGLRAQRFFTCRCSTQ
jgi:hypothetical protein